MPDLYLHAIAERYHRALEAKPSKGPISEKGIAAITDSVADVPELLAEVSGIRARWDEVSEDESWWIDDAWGDYGEVVVPLRVLTYILDGELDQTPLPFGVLEGDGDE